MSELAISAVMLFTFAMGYWIGHINGHYAGWCKGYEQCRKNRELLSRNQES